MKDVIYVERIKERWRVWMGREGDDSRPAKCGDKFYKFEDAMQYASDWVLNSSAERVVVREEMSDGRAI